MNVQRRDKREFVFTPENKDPLTAARALIEEDGSGRVWLYINFYPDNLELMQVELEMPRYNFEKLLQQLKDINEYLSEHATTQTR